VLAWALDQNPSALWISQPFNIAAKTKTARFPRAVLGAPLDRVHFDWR